MPRCDICGRKSITMYRVKNRKFEKQRLACPECRAVLKRLQRLEEWERVE